MASHATGERVGGADEEAAGLPLDDLNPLLVIVAGAYHVRLRRGQAIKRVMGVLESPATRQAPPDHVVMHDGDAQISRRTFRQPLCCTRQLGVGESALYAPVARIPGDCLGKGAGGRVEADYRHTRNTEGGFDLWANVRAILLVQTAEVTQAERSVPPLGVMIAGHHTRGGERAKPSENFSGLLEFLDACSLGKVAGDHDSIERSRRGQLLSRGDMLGHEWPTTVDIRQV